MVLTNFNFPKHHWSNITVNRKFKRSNITAYRGESRHSGTNMARYGQGIINLNCKLLLFIAICM